MPDTRIIKRTGESIADYRKRKREERKAKGQCLHCNKPRLDGVQFCQDHAREARASYRRYINKKPLKDRSQALAEWRKQNIQKGNCSLCVRPAAPGKRRCEYHLEFGRKGSRLYKAWLKKRAKAGFCVQCGIEPKLDKNERCEMCYFKTVANKRLGSPRHAHMLKRLFEASGGICKYTGQSMVLGQNAHLDHIQPRSKGGTHDESNLQWISADANHLKHTYTEKEFRAVLKMIVENCRERF